MSKIKIKKKDFLPIPEENNTSSKRSSPWDDEDSNKRRLDADKMFGSRDDLANLNDQKEVDEKQISESINSLSLSDINITLTTPNSSPTKDDSNSQNYLHLASLQSQLDLGIRGRK